MDDFIIICNDFKVYPKTIHPSHRRPIPQKYVRFRSSQNPDLESSTQTLEVKAASHPKLKDKQTEGSAQ